MTSFALKDRVCGEWMESVRKDIECFFGMLKQRFRFLLNPIQYHSFTDIECDFKCCCILHNMLISNNGSDLADWEKSIDWTSIDPDLQDLMFENAMQENITIDPVDAIIIPRYIVPIHLPGYNFDPHYAGHYDLLRSSIVTHFYQHYILSLMKWPSRSSVTDRFKLRIPRTLVSAVVLLNLKLYE